VGAPRADRLRSLFSGLPALPKLIVSTDRGPSAITRAQVNTAPSRDERRIRRSALLGCHDDASMTEREYLVAYDYGMGGLWAVMVAPSADAITAVYPELGIAEERPPSMATTSTPA
jgi:hypothetical protein